MRKKIWIMLLAVSLILAFSIGAYARENMPIMLSTDSVKVGSWAKIAQYNHGEKTVMWIGAVGEKVINGKRYVWMEMRITHNGMKMITKMLMRFSIVPQKVDIKRIIFKQDNKPAIEIPAQMASMAGNMMFTQPKPDRKNEYTIHTIGKETITVPAGTFVTTHIKLVKKSDPSQYIDVWKYPEVLTQIVQVKEKGKVQMILLAYGSGAKTAITEKPKKFNIPIPSN